MSVDAFRVMELCTPIPLELAGQLMRAVGDELERRGYAAFVREETGAGVIWARPLPEVGA